jgi:hypothetical protein
VVAFLLADALPATLVEDMGTVLVEHAESLAPTPALVLAPRARAPVPVLPVILSGLAGPGRGRLRRVRGLAHLQGLVRRVQSLGQGLGLGRCPIHRTHAIAEVAVGTAIEVVRGQLVEEGRATAEIGMILGIVGLGRRKKHNFSR